MRKITKKAIKGIKKGHFDDLMDAIEYLLDSYDENKFNLGYKSCLSDMSVRAQRLARHIITNLNTGGSYLDAPEDKLVNVIEEYFKDALDAE